MRTPLTLPLAIVSLCVSATLADAPLVYCQCAPDATNGMTRYQYEVDAASYPMMEFSVGTNDLYLERYYNVEVPPGWVVTIEPDGVSHGCGVNTPHGDVSDAVCDSLTAGRVRWYTNDPEHAIEHFVFRFWHPAGPEDVGWLLHCQRPGDPPTDYLFTESWLAPVGTGVGPLHGPYLTTTCWSNAECPDDHYCFFADCLAETGICVPRPMACFDIWAPVCGCDGQTYGNGCVAAAAGVSIDYFGPCEGTMCWSNEDCVFGYYCFMESCDAPVGNCREKPIHCYNVWDPVCGCDGNTYSNACYAAQAGVNVDYEGPCEGFPCWDNDDCGPQHYCYKETCDQQEGVCAMRPIRCPLYWDPVCGCDGQTYSNACHAAAAGVNVDYEGPCEGFPCWDNDDCGPESYCYREDCSDESGICVMRPEACTLEWDPVCGCNGVTYPNACQAAMAGQNILMEGPCYGSYCWSNDDCGAGSYCYFENCDDEMGTCTPRPQACTMEWDPVCGCNGVTYANACHAAMAGQSILIHGPCFGSYCWSNDDCGPDSYCHFDNCDDDIGTCTPRLIDCPDVFDPVCGCDGQTYGNACFAAMMGVSVAYPGICRCTGDMNCDGAINFDDINAFVLAMVDRNAYEAAHPFCPWLNGDCNHDETVNFDDINGFVDLLVGDDS